MKILLVHNFYGRRAPSGENVVVQEEFNLLIKFGNNVLIYSRENDEILSRGLLGLIVGALSTVWNWREYFRFKKILKEFVPDVIHIHNTFPLISPSILYAINSKTPTVVTLHNYRIFCAAGIPMRDGKVCTLCIDKKSIIPSLMYKCYRKNLFATVPLALNILIHRKLNTWNKHVTNFIVLAEFHKKLFIKAGINKEKIIVKPNFYSGNPSMISISERKNEVIFVGRLAPEKGIFTLLNAWKILGNNAPKLLIIGDGPLKGHIKKYINEFDNGKITLMGLKTQEDTVKLISHSKLLILPSECFEGFPMVIREAYAWGTPVAVSNLGPLPEIVEDMVHGIVFKAGDSFSIAEKINPLLHNQILLNEMSLNVKNKFIKYLSEEVNYKLLLSAYKSYNV